MNEKTPILSADYITTEHDYVYTSLAQRKVRISRGDRIIMCVLGTLAIFLGLYMLIFSSGGLIKNICWTLLIAIGLFSATFYEFTGPVLIRNRAKNIYRANKEKFVSISITFFEDEVKITSDRYKANIPYRCFFKVLDDKRVIIFYLDENDYIAVPKRLFSDKDRGNFEKIKELFGEKNLSKNQIVF